MAGCGIERRSAADSLWRLIRSNIFEFKLRHDQDYESRGHVIRKSLETVELLGYRHAIHTFDAEEAVTSVLAIHGFGASGRSYRHVAPMYADAGVSIVAPDQLNFGESEKPEDGYSLRMYAQLAVEVLDHVGLERPFLMGHSAGGKVAAVTAALFPERFQGLILVNSGGFSRLAPVLLLADTPLFHIADTRFFRRWILGRFSIGETVEAEEQWEAFRRFHGENAALDIDRSDLRQAVRAISMPTQVVWGMQDRMIPSSTVDRIRSDIPNAEVVRLTDAGHTPMRDSPQAFADSTLEFILRTVG